MFPAPLRAWPDAARDLTIVPATSSDALDTWLALRNAARPESPITREVVDASLHRTPHQCRLLALRGDAAVAAGMASTDRFGAAGSMFVQVLVPQPERERGTASALLHELAAWALTNGGTTFRVSVDGADGAALAFWQGRGFTTVDHCIISELVLADRPAVTPPTPPAGVELTTLAERPDLLEATWQLHEAVVPDMPGEVPLGAPLQAWAQAVRDEPGRSLDQVHLVLVDGELAGYAELEFAPEQPGTPPRAAAHPFTGVLPAFRRRGLARLLKQQVIARAASAGVTRVRAYNHHDNVAMRALNAELGYAPVRDDLRLGGAVAHRVARVDRGWCTVWPTDAPAERRVACSMPVTVGDLVQVADDAVASVHERRSAIMRGAAGCATTAQAVAANVDVAFVVASLEVEVNVRRLERFLAVAWSSGATPVVLLTKCDLAGNDLDDVLAEVRAALVGVDVVPVTSLEPGGLDVLAPWLAAGTTAVLLGPSGAGKSTLVNRLARADHQSVQATRGDGKGRHTTTSRELLELPGGAWLIDTPGVRELRLWDAGDGIAQVFDDVEQVASACRFSDCAHEGEPGCAVQAAVDAGELTRRGWRAGASCSASRRGSTDVRTAWPGARNSAAGAP